MNNSKKLTIAGLAVAGVITGGALTAAVLPAVAETSTPTPAPSSSAAPDDRHGPHQANGITEEPLTGDAAAKAKAAVEAAYPDATIDRLETDAEGAAYEAHITQADGSRATVKLDESFTVTGMETGGPGGGRHGDHDGDQDGDQGSDSDSDSGGTAS
jgi:hypothetical protein